MLKVDIKKVEKTKTFQCTYLGIYLSTMYLGKYAKFNVNIYDEKKEIVDTNIVLIEGEDYKKWGEDDQYIVDYICEKLGFSILHDNQQKTESRTIEPLKASNHVQPVQPTQPVQLVRSTRSTRSILDDVKTHEIYRNNKHPNQLIQSFIPTNKPYSVNIVDNYSRQK